MMTATITNTPAATDPSPVTVDFDTRLMLTGISMDVRLGDDTAVSEARQAVADAIADADRHRCQSGRWEAATRQPETFRSHPVLRRAGDLIRERGWHQGSWDNSEGAVCAWQAVKLAAGGDTNAETNAVATLLDRIRREFGDEGSVSGWNDRQGRTVDEVLRVLS